MNDWFQIIKDNFFVYLSRKNNVQNDHSLYCLYLRCGGHHNCRNCHNLLNRTEMRVEESGLIESYICYYLSTYLNTQQI